MTGCFKKREQQMQRFRENRELGKEKYDFITAGISETGEDGGMGGLQGPICRNKIRQTQPKSPVFNDFREVPRDDACFERPLV